MRTLRKILLEWKHVFKRYNITSLTYIQIHPLYIIRYCCRCYGNLSICTLFVQLYLVCAASSHNNFCEAMWWDFFLGFWGSYRKLPVRAMAVTQICSWLDGTDRYAEVLLSYHIFENVLTENRNKISITYYKWSLLKKSVLREDMSLNKMKETFKCLLASWEIESKAIPHNCDNYLPHSVSKLEELSV